MIWRDMSKVYTTRVLLEYSEEFIVKHVKRLSQQAGVHVTEEAIRYYINRFDQLKRAKGVEVTQKLKRLIEDGADNFKPSARDQGNVEGLMQRGGGNTIEKLKSNPLQIEYYNWKQLETIVDSFPPPEKKVAKSEAGSKPPAQIVYSKDGIIIFFGENQQTCVNFQAWVRQQNLPKIKQAIADGFHSTPESWYSFCIGWPSAGSNLYTGYRFGRGGAPASIYYVYDNNLPVTDKKHMMVIQPQKDNGKYLTTIAFNNEGDKLLTWEQLLQVKPELAPAKDVLVFRPYTEAEQMYVALKDATAKDFKGFANFKIKEAYISTPQPHTGTPKKIYKDDFLELPPALQHAYINARSPTLNQKPFDVLLSLLNLFEDTDPKEPFAKFAKAKEIFNRTKGVDANGNPDTSHHEPVTNDPIVSQCAQQQSYRYYKKLITDMMNANKTEKKT